MMAANYINSIQASYFDTWLLFTARLTGASMNA